MLDRLAGQLERYMDLLSARQKLVASNIANADTPGYHTQDIDFQSEFEQRARGRAAGGRGVGPDGQERRQQRQSRSRSRACWPKTPCAFSWPRTCCGRRFAWSVPPSRRANRHEPVFGTFGQRLRHGGAAHARRTAGGESGQRRNHPHAGRRPVPPQGRGVRERCRWIRRFRRSSSSELESAGRRDGVGSRHGHTRSGAALSARASGCRRGRLRGLPPRQSGRRHGGPDGRLARLPGQRGGHRRGERHDPASIDLLR